LNSDKDSQLQILSNVRTTMADHLGAIERGVICFQGLLAFASSNSLGIAPNEKTSNLIKIYEKSIIDILKRLTSN